MSIRLPQTYLRTISSELAMITKQTASEADLWQAVYELCTSAELSTNENAPDYAVFQVIQPKLDIVKLELEDIDE